MRGGAGWAGWGGGARPAEKSPRFFVLPSFTSTADVCPPKTPSPPPSLFPQEDFEAALASHRAAWQADFDAQRAALETAFAEQKAALADELVEKARERRAVKNMVVSLVFVLRLLM